MHYPSAWERGNELFPKDGSGKLKVVNIDYVDTFKAMEKMVTDGKTKAIGVSNFSKKEVERLIKECSVVSLDSPIVRNDVAMPSNRNLIHLKGTSRPPTRTPSLAPTTLIHGLPRPAQYPRNPILALRQSERLLQCREISKPWKAHG